MNELQVIDSREIMMSQEQTVARVSHTLALVHQLLREVLKEGIDKDFSIIPGTKKRSLHKPGGEKIALLLSLTPTFPFIEDLSTENACRYRCKCELVGPDGRIVGESTAFCSSREDKMAWVKAVCHEQFEATPDSMRRLKWFENGTSIEQIHRECADMEHNVLSKAQKRAFIAAVRVASASSDLFSDSDELIANAEQAPIARPQAKSAPAAASATAGHAPEGAEVADGVASVAFVKGAQGAKGPYKSHGIKVNGIMATTFDDKALEIATASEGQKKPVRMVWKAQGNFKNMVSIAFIDAAPAPTTTDSEPTKRDKLNSRLFDMGIADAAILAVQKKARKDMTDAELAACVAHWEAQNQDTLL